RRRNEERFRCGLTWPLEVRSGLCEAKRALGRSDPKRKEKGWPSHRGYVAAGFPRRGVPGLRDLSGHCRFVARIAFHCRRDSIPGWIRDARSEEHTSELQSRVDLVCRLLLE